MEHDFSIKAILHKKDVVRCSRTMCFAIWYSGKDKPTSKCKGKVNGPAAS